ncbi:hypothetical protein J1605_010979 [Eschrichtius robustus]|uniref:Exo-alpha-sialidase n=1 Tax=Eschrichtius robustus TaxID=9764 RepID=A0AB34GMW5_ESCRO|nr:hypothetical protein J1605_010979 [Eschrichtius robustus]
MRAKGAGILGAKGTAGRHPGQLWPLVAARPQHSQEVAWLAGRSWILTQPWGTASSRLPATEWALVSACERVGEASIPAAAPQPALRGPLLRHLRFLSQPLDPTALGGANSLPSLCTRTRGPAPVSLPQTVLFQGKRADLTYRVPSLLPVPPGPTLLAFAEQQLSPDDAHAHRLVQRTDTLAGGPVRWGAALVLRAAALDEHRSRNPCPVHVARTAGLPLHRRARPRGRADRCGRERRARLCCVTSGDAGRSWGGARDLTAEAVGGAEQDWATFAVGSTHGVRLGSGRLLVLAYTYRVDRRECFGEICGTDPHSFAGQLAVVDRGPAGGILYCNAWSPLGSHVQVLSVDEGASFLPGELVLALAETAGGCQDSIVGFLAPPSSRPEDEGCTEPWAIHEGPSGYSDLASIRPTPERALTFACLYESGTGVSYEEISFCMFSLQEVLGNAQEERGGEQGRRMLGGGGAGVSA